MDISKVVMGLVSLLIAIIFIALVAVPVIEDSQNGVSFDGENTTSVHYEKVSGKAWSVSRTGDTITTTIGSETWSYTKASTEWTITSDKFMLRFNNNGTSIWDFADNAYYNSINPSTNAVTVSCTAAGVMTATNTAETLNVSISGVGFSIIKWEKGTWMRSSTPVKVTPGQEIYIGNFPLDTETTGPIRLYSVTNGQDPTALITPVYQNGSALVSMPVTSLKVDYEEIGTGQVVGYYSKVTTGYTYEGTAKTTTSNYYWCPIAFESAATTEADTNALLLSVIPVLLIIVTIMIAVRMIGAKDW